MTVSMTEPAQDKSLSPRAYFSALVIVCAISLGWMVFVELDRGMFLGTLGLIQQVSYIALILLGSIGILVGIAMKRGRLALIIATLCTMALLANFVFACLQFGGEMGWWSGPVSQIRQASAMQFSESTWTLLGISLAGWNGTIALVLGVVSLATLLKWSRN